MARIRTVKPEFWTHEDLSALPAETHLLAGALLNYADDHGYFNANPRLVRASCCPLRDDKIPVEKSLLRLAEIGYIEVGTADDGKRYGRISNFSSHQRVSHPTISKIASRSITWDSLQNPPEKFRSPPESFGPEQGTGNREQGTGNGLGLTAHVGQEPDDPVAAVFSHWQTVHNHPRARLDEKRRRLIRRALKHYALEDLLQAISGYKNSPHHMGANESRTVYDSIDLILRDAKHIDAGLQFHGAPPRQAESRPALTRYERIYGTESEEDATDD